MNSTDQAAEGIDAEEPAELSGRPPTAQAGSGPPGQPDDRQGPRHGTPANPVTVTDAELITQLTMPGIPGRRAWTILVGRHSHRMYAVARSFSLDEATAEDLVQTAWLRLLERADQLREPGSVGPWLCTIVRNEARKLVTRRREIPVDTVTGDGAIDGVESSLVQDERARALRFAFARLGRECQQLLRLLVADPVLSYDEIAAALGRPRGSLGPTRRRCLDQLRSRLPTGFEP